MNWPRAWPDPSHAGRRCDALELASQLPCSPRWDWPTSATPAANSRSDTNAPTTLSARVAVVIISALGRYSRRTRFAYSGTKSLQQHSFQSRYRDKDKTGKTQYDSRFDELAE